VTDVGSAPTGLSAPAKLTLSLRVTGVRPDGYHLIESEMVTVDLADRLVVEEGDGLSVSTDRPWGGPAWSPAPVRAGPDNLVRRALAAVGRTARVHLVKRVPPGAGLGGGSADAAAILRWAGCSDPVVAASIGADVPFCVSGGRALVRGVGEEVEPLPFADRSFVLLLAPFGVDTGAVYRAWDTLAARDRRMPSGPQDVAGAGEANAGEGAPNQLEAAALVVEPRLARWRQQLESLTGRPARLAGSGSTWFVEGTATELGLAGPGPVPMEVGGETGLLVPVRATSGVR
jgi:4-diphosphocytidyl-2-C-methyl-D-erythritol kinase